MAYGYTHAGIEWRERYLWTNTVDRPTTMDILLYDDETDAVAADDDLGAITTEPTDGQYARQRVGFSTDVELEAPTVGDDEDPEGQPALAHLTGVAFDVTDTTGEVDSWGAVLECELQGDAEPREHLVVRVPLTQRVDLAEWDGERALEGAAFASQPNL